MLPVKRCLRGGGDEAAGAGRSVWPALISRARRSGGCDESDGRETLLCAISGLSLMDVLGAVSTLKVGALWFGSGFAFAFASGLGLGLAPSGGEGALEWIG